MYTLFLLYALPPPFKTHEVASQPKLDKLMSVVMRQDVIKKSSHFQDKAVPKSFSPRYFFKLFPTPALMQRLEKSRGKAVAFHCPNPAAGQEHARWMKSNLNLMVPADINQQLPPTPRSMRTLPGPSSVRSSSSAK